MVDDKIIPIIHTNLKKCIKIDDIKFFSSNGLVKYVFNISNYCFEISYEFIDYFYRIQLQKNIIINCKI